MNLFEFYKEEPRNHHHPNAEPKAQLHSDYLDQIAVESSDSLSLDLKDPLQIQEAVQTPDRVYTDSIDLENEEIQVPDTVSELEDQIAMESVNQHLKRLNSYGLKDHLETDLIIKLTTVQPAPISNNSWSYFHVNIYMFSFSWKYNSNSRNLSTS